MIEETAKSYSSYIQPDVVSRKFSEVQEIVDNMLTRLEEFESVLSVVDSKQKDAEILSKKNSQYRKEIDQLQKKVFNLELVVKTLNKNLDVLEKKVEDSEQDFGIQTESILQSFLKPFMSKKKNITSTEEQYLESITGYFENEADV